jgi:DNA repair protein RadA/Sms
VARARTIHRCTDCGSASPRWVGRCPGCGEWNTLIEEREVPQTATRAASASPSERPVPILEVDAAEYTARPTGVPELDRVLGGGLVPGSVTLVGGEPGIGKSTLLLQTLASLAESGSTSLLVSAEESKQQVRLRAERLEALPARLYIVSETSLPAIIEALDEIRPDYLVVDSIQTVFDPELGSAPGSVAQVRECAHALVREAKQRGTAIVLVGHVTKEGSLAGPRVLEHVVDTVLSFEGDRHHALRLLRAVKHRFGGTGELGVFEMRGDGLAGVRDPSALFLGDRRPGVAGSAVVPTIEGHRPLLVELQALVSPTSFPQPRRSAQGLDSGRLSLLLAVLAQRVGVAFGQADVYASAVGGARIEEPGADLPLALALTSSLTGVALPANLVAVGEVGLGGELRQVSQMQRRLSEAARLGFTRAVVPASAPEAPDGIRLMRAGTLADAVDLLGLLKENAMGSSAQVVPLPVR